MNTKDKILKTALKLFAKQGIAKTSTAQITKEVGIAEGTLFVHFKTKQDLIDSLYLNIKKDLGKGIDKCLDQDCVEKSIKTVSKEMIARLVKNYDQLVFMELIEKDPRVSKKALEEAERDYKASSELLEMWKREGYLKNINRELLHDTMWSQMRVTAKYCKKNNKKVSDKMIDIIWDAIKA